MIFTRDLLDKFLASTKGKIAKNLENSKEETNKLFNEIADLFSEENDYDFRLALDILIDSIDNYTKETILRELNNCNISNYLKDKIYNEIFCSQGE